MSSRFPAPPPAELPRPPSPQLQIDDDGDDNVNEGEEQQLRPLPSATEPFEIEKVRPIGVEMDDSSDEEEGELDYLTEQYLQDKRIFEEQQDMYAHIPEIDTSTVDAKNIISLILRDDVPYMQRRIVTLIAKTIAEQSMEMKVERTHNDNTLLSLKKSTDGNEDAPDYSVQINIQSKSDFIKRQNDKRKGYIPTPLNNPLDNFNSGLYFKTIDNMVFVRPGKPVIRSFVVQKSTSTTPSAQEKIIADDDKSKENTESPESAGFDPLAAIQEGMDLETYQQQQLEKELQAQQEEMQQNAYLQMIAEHEEQQKSNRHNAANGDDNEQEKPKGNQSTFLLPSRLGAIDDPDDYFDVNKLIAHGCAEGCINDWGDASVTGLPLGHIFLHSTVSQSTHMLMTNALTPLPTLIIYTCDAQSLGRGRSANSWVSPPGCLMYNFAIKVMNTAFLPFVQYYSSWVTVKALHFALQHCCECCKCQLNHPHNKINTLKSKKAIKKAKKQAQLKYDLLYTDTTTTTTTNDNDNTSSSSSLTKLKQQILNKTKIIDACMDTIDIKVKWPNDIYVNNKKVSGTMLSSVCDMMPNGGGYTFTAHLGTGLNVSNGAANGNTEFANKYQQFLTINDSIMESYQQQIKTLNAKLTATAAGDNTAGDQNKDNNDDVDIDNIDLTGLPPLLDQEDIDFMLLQEEQFQQALERNTQIDKKYGIADEEEEEEDDDDGDNDDLKKQQEQDDIQNKLQKKKQQELEEEKQMLKELQNTLQQLPLLSKEVVLAALTLYITLSLPIFNQFGFVPFYKDYYSMWLQQDQIVTISTAQTGFNVDKKYKIKGLDEETGYLLAMDMSFADYETNPKAIVEMHPDSHSFDMKTMTVRPKAQPKKQEDVQEQTPE